MPTPELAAAPPTELVLTSVAKPDRDLDNACRGLDVPGGVPQRRVGAHELELQEDTTNRIRTPHCTASCDKLDI